MKGLRFVWMAPLLVAGLVACESVQTTGGGALGLDRSQRMMVSANEVEQASAEQYNEVIAEAKEQGVLDRDAAQVRRVNNIVNRLVAQVGVFRADAPAWSWEVHVLTSDDLNAWCMAGGKMAIYSGLIERLELTDDEIAAVMGHEIAHALREHARERVSRSMATSLGVSLASALLGAGQVGTDLMSQVANVTFELPHSRLHETEADQMGVELAARAGYDPRAAQTLWNKMSKASTGAPPQWLSTHPSHSTRQHELAVASDRVLPLYQAARR